jgi:O-antigen chain-terminating methyltransferase
MLLHNNSDLDFGELAQRLEQVASGYRRATPLFSQAPSESPTVAAAPTAQGSRWRRLLKGIPVLGISLVWAASVHRSLRIPGITWKQRVRLMPGVGRLALWANGIVRAHDTRARLTEATGRLDQLQYAHTLNAQRLQAIEALDPANRLSRLENTFAVVNALQQRALASETQVQQLHLAVDRLMGVVERMEFTHAEQQNRIASLVRQISDLRSSFTAQPAMSVPASATPAKKQVVRAAADSIDTNNFYVEFESVFRGSPEDIRQRFEVYLPYFERFTGNSTAQVVDVGCGRGEWLQLLKERGIRGTGIDLNASMVEVCRMSGIPAECADAIAYLRAQPEGSLAAVTGFHIIEHLPFELLIGLFDAAVRALRDDGLIIFETPNPENVAVGSCNFYADPTHIRPIVPMVAEFIARQRGFAKTEILRLHPYPDNHKVPEDSEMARRFNKFFYGPQDYAILAWKTDAS